MRTKLMSRSAVHEEARVSRKLPLDTGLGSKNRLRKASAKGSRSSTNGATKGRVSSRARVRDTYSDEEEGPALTSTVTSSYATPSRPLSAPPERFNPLDRPVDPYQEDCLDVLYEEEAFEEEDDEHHAVSRYREDGMRRQDSEEEWGGSYQQHQQQQQQQQHPQHDVHSRHDVRHDVRHEDMEDEWQRELHDEDEDEEYMVE